MSGFDSIVAEEDKRGAVTCRGCAGGGRSGAAYPD